MPGPAAARVHVAHTASHGVGYRARVPDQGKSHRARAGLRQLAAGLAIALLASLHTGAAPIAAAVPSPETTHFLDHGGPILHTAQIYLLYWGGHWPATGIYFPTPDQITAAVRTVLAGPYLSGLAQYRGIQPAVLRGSTIVTTSNPHNGFNEHGVANFLNTQLDAGVVPGPDPDNQSLYIVVMPVGISAGGYFYEFDGEHYDYQRDEQRIHVVWAADSGSLDGATRIISYELVESIIDPEGSAVRGTSSTCEQSGWCEIADVCFDTSLVNGVAVSPYWSEHAHACIAPIRPHHRCDCRTRESSEETANHRYARRRQLPSAPSQAGTSLAHNRGRRPCSPARIVGDRVRSHDHDA
jgi:hypothetical protein